MLYNDSMIDKQTSNQASGGSSKERNPSIQNTKDEAVGVEDNAGAADAPDANSKSGMLAMKFKNVD